MPFDSLLSIVQMPPGIVAATVGVDRGDHAALLATQIIAVRDHDVRARLEQHRRDQAEEVLAANASLRAELGMPAVVGDSGRCARLIVKRPRGGRRMGWKPFLAKGRLGRGRWSVLLVRPRTSGDDDGDGAGSTTASTAASAPTPTGPSPGVTDDTIKIGRDLRRHEGASRR